MSYSKNRNCQNLLSHVRLEKSWGPVSSGKHLNHSRPLSSMQSLRGNVVDTRKPSKQGLRGEMSSTISCCVLAISWLPIFLKQPGSQKTQKPMIKSRAKHESRGSLRTHRQINDWQRYGWDRACGQVKIVKHYTCNFFFGKENSWAVQRMFISMLLKMVLTVYERSVSEVRPEKVCCNFNKGLFK